MTPEPEPGGGGWRAELCSVFCVHSGSLINVYVPDGSGHSGQGGDADKYAASAADIINNIGDK